VTSLRADAGTDRATIQSVTRAAEILRLLARKRRPCGVVDVARELSVPTRTVSGILRTLQMVGLAEQDRDSGNYQLGAALLPIGFAYLHSSSLRGAALNPAQRLAMYTGESVRVGTLHRAGALIVHHVAISHPVQVSEVGTLVPAHACALGKALLMQDDAAFGTAVEDGFDRCTADTITSAVALRRELDESSRRGWASAAGELSPDAGSIAAPIPAVNLAFPAAIELEGPSTRLYERGSPCPTLVRAVTDSARAISRQLGGTNY
jgi:DNA-binding IclR family transcriptional regulator